MHHIFMYDGRDKNTNSQINSSTKHILNTYGGVMQNKIYLCIYIMINIYFRVCVRIFNRWKKTYQVQTNLFVQTLQTSIWATGSTSKGRCRGSGRGDLQKCDYPIQGRAVNCTIIQSAHAPWILIWWPRLEFTRFARRGWFALDMFPWWKGREIDNYNYWPHSYINF